MLDMPLSIGRQRSLSPQPHHRNEYQHSPHPPRRAAKATPSNDLKVGSPANQATSHTDRKTPVPHGVNIVNGRALHAPAGHQSPKLGRHAKSGIGRHRNQDDSTVDATGVKNHRQQLATCRGGGDVDRESQRLLKSRQREAAEGKKSRNGVSGNGRGIGDDLANVLVHAPINLNLPRVPSRQNSPCPSPPRTRKLKLGKSMSEKGESTKHIKVVVRDFSNVIKSEPQPHRTASDSDLNKNETLLSPMQRKRSMSANSLFPKATQFRRPEFRPADVTSRSATSSPMHAPVIQVEQCIEDLRLGANDLYSRSIPRGEAEEFDKWVDDDDLCVSPEEGKIVWNANAFLKDKSAPPDYSLKGNSIRFSPGFRSQQHTPSHLKFGDSPLRPCKSESNLHSVNDTASLAPRSPRPSLVLNDDENLSEDIRDSLRAHATSPSSSLLQLPSLKSSDLMFEGRLEKLSRSFDGESSTEIPAPGHPKASQPSGTTRVPTLPEVKLTLTGPRVAPRRTASGPTVGSPCQSPLKANRRQTDGLVSYGYLTAGRDDVVSPPMTPVLPSTD